MDEENTAKDLFDTKERRAEAVMAFRGLLNDPGWKLLTKIIFNKIGDIRHELEEGVEEETPAEVQNRRNLLKAHKWFINFPQMQIDAFTKNPGGFDSAADELDPFEQREETVAGRRNT